MGALPVINAGSQGGWRGALSTTYAPRLAKEPSYVHLKQRPIAPPSSSDSARYRFQYCSLMVFSMHSTFLPSSVPVTAMFVMTAVSVAACR